MKTGVTLPGRHLAADDGRKRCSDSVSRTSPPVAGSPIKPENYEGIRLYWVSRDIHALRDRLERLGYPVSKITDRDYGQTEFFVTDDDGYAHCFGVATKGS